MASEEAAEELRCRVCLESEVNELISMFCVVSTQNMLLSHMTLACTGILVSNNQLSLTPSFFRIKTYPQILDIDAR